MAPLLLLLLLAAAVMVVTPASPSPSPSPSPSSPAKLGCWFVEEAASGGGRGSVMPSSLLQRPALLLLPPPGTRADEADLESELPPEVEAGLAFQVLDPSGTVWGSRGSSRPLWLGDGPDPVACEVNAYVPQEARVPWAAGLEGGQGCPRSLEGGKWFIATVQSPEAGYGVSAILHQELPPPRTEQRPGAPRTTGSVVTTATVVLSVFTRTPRLRSRLGQDVVIDCGFSGPSSRFSVEWRHQHGGSGRVVLAYDGASGRVSVAEEGARLFLDPHEGGNVSLQLEGVGVRHEGTYICTVYLPYMHAQQAAELRVLEPPKVALRPDPLPVAPGANAELSCGISGYYPQSVSVVWRRRGPAAGDEELSGSWESGHHQAPDGTFSFTSYVRLPAVRPQDHGATVSCHVAHPALGETTLRKDMTLRVAGSSGPSMEDAVGLFLIAFALFGFLQAFSRRVFGEKTKSQKVD